jgi:hypothetical protein
MSGTMIATPRSQGDLGSKRELTPSVPTQIVSGGSPYDPAGDREGVPKCAQQQFPYRSCLPR